MVRSSMDLGCWAKCGNENQEPICRRSLAVSCEMNPVGEVEGLGRNELPEVEMVFQLMPISRDQSVGAFSLLLEVLTYVNRYHHRFLNSPSRVQPSPCLSSFPTTLHLWDE